MNEALEQLAPLMHDIALVAVGKGDEENRQKINAALEEIEKSGGQLLKPVHAIWDGERDPEKLTAGIEQYSAKLVIYILRLIELIPLFDEVIDSFPDSVKEAIETGDESKVKEAINNLPPDEREIVIEKMKKIGVMGLGFE